MYMQQDENGQAGNGSEVDHSAMYVYKQVARCPHEHPKAGQPVEKSVWVCARS